MNALLVRSAGQWARVYETLRVGLFPTTSSRCKYMSSPDTTIYNRGDCTSIVALSYVFSNKALYSIE